MNSSPKDVPNMLNTGQIRRHGGPVHSVHIVNTEKVVNDTNPMRSGVVVLEYRVSDWHLVQIRQHVRCQNFVDVSLTFLVSVDEYKKVVNDTNPMRSGVVVLEYRVSDWHLVQIRQHVRCQNFVNKVRLSHRRDTGPHHEATSVIGYPRYHCS